MKRASVSELKASLSAYLVGVKNGEEVLVTERGRPIARLIPAHAVDRASDRLERLIRAGVVRAPSGKLSKDLLEASPVRDPGGKTVEALIEERRSGR